ncbi:MAG: helicase-related protein, partial [Candidatus Thorarchaeota archaeon]
PIIEDPKSYDAPEITLVNYSKPREKRKQLAEDLLDLAEEGTRTLVYMKAIDAIYDFLDAEGSELASSVSFDIDHLVLDRLGRISNVLEDLDYRLPELVSSGVGCYHGQMTNSQRWFIEWAFRRKYIRFLFGTEALAYGVNTPVSHVVMESPGIDEVFRQSMMARAVRMRRGRGRPGRCTVYSQTIRDVKSLERVYCSPKLPIRFVARSQLSKALIARIGLGLIRNEDDRKGFSEKLDLLFKKSSTSRVMKELMSSDSPFVILNDSGEYELTILGNAAFESCLSEHQTRRILEGISILQSTITPPTEFDVLLLACYSMAVEDERAVSKEGVDVALK